MSRLWFNRCRRGTALLLACAFLLLDLSTAAHHHEVPPRMGCSLHHHGGFLEKAVFTPEHPGDCFACFWGRTAVAARLAACPRFAPPEAVWRRVPADVPDHPCPLLNGGSSRAPPSLLA